MTIPYKVITAIQRCNLIDAENCSTAPSFVIPCGEDGTCPSDFSYRNAAGEYEIDEAGYIHAIRCGFNWEDAKRPGYVERNYKRVY